MKNKRKGLSFLLPFKIAQYSDNRQAVMPVSPDTAFQMVAQMNGPTKILVIDVTMKPVTQLIVHFGGTDEETEDILMRDKAAIPPHAVIDFHIT